MGDQGWGRNEGEPLDGGATGASPPPQPDWQGAPPPQQGAPPPHQGAPPPPGWAPPQPGSAPPQPGWAPPGQGYGTMPPPPQGNGVAVASLVLGIFALILGIIPVLFLLGIPLAIAAIVTGIIGRSKAKRVQRGKGQALAGLILGILGLVAAIAWIVAGMFVLGNPQFWEGFEEAFEEELEDGGGGGSGRSVDVFALQVGDCFNDPPDFTEVSRLEVVPCSEPHDNEVIAHVDHPDAADYPGEDVMIGFGAEHCEGEVFTSYVGVPYVESRYLVDSLFPTAESWREGDRTITCMVYDTEPITGSVRGRRE